MPPYPPGWKAASTDELVALSSQTNGVASPSASHAATDGTPSGALAGLIPTLMPVTPAATSSGIVARVREGTSRCDRTVGTYTPLANQFFKSL